MMPELKSYTRIILLSGLFVVLAGFFLLIPAENRTNIFWLNLVVTGIIYAVLALVQLGLLVITGPFERQIGVLGVRISFAALYALAAIAAMVSGYFFGFTFKTQFFLQILSGFLLVLGFVFSGISRATTDNVESERQWKQKGKETMSERVHQLDVLATQFPDVAGVLRQRVAAIKEGIRYLSPSNNPSARMLDGEIIDAIQQACLLTGQGDPNQQGAIAMLDKVGELIKLRKKILN